MHRAVAFGVLGGITLTAMELMVLPFPAASRELRDVAIRVTPQWILAAVGIACLVAHWEGRVRARTLAFILLAYGVVMAALFSVARLVIQRSAGPAHDPMLGVDAPLVDTLAYDVWMMLFFGGLFAVACVLGVRAERIRRVLARREVERRRLEALLGEAEIAQLRAQVDPVLLLRIMAEVQARYVDEPHGAERLINRLVDFLHHAMPGVRSGSSTLTAEIALVRSCIELFRELDPSTSCAIDAPATLPDVAFPALVLLPLITAREARPWPGVRLSVRSDEHLMTIHVHTATTEPNPDARAAALYRLRVGLETTLPGRWRLAPWVPAPGGGETLRLQLAVAHPVTSAVTLNGVLS